MKINALITMLVLGSSSAAMASPSVSFSGHAQARWSVGTSRSTNYTRPVGRPVPPPPHVEPIVRDHRRPAGTTSLSTYDRYEGRYDDGGLRDRRPAGITNISTSDLYEGRYDDGGFRVVQPVVQPRWTELASEISFSSRSAKMPSDQTTVHVGGQLELIRIDGEQGYAFIKQVFVRFADGTGKTFEVHQMLSPGMSITVDIGQRSNVKAMRLFSAAVGRGEIPAGTFTVSGA